MKNEEDFQAWLMYKCCVCGNWFYESEIWEPSFELHAYEELNEPELIAYNEMGEPGYICKSCHEQKAQPSMKLEKNKEGA